MVLKGRGRGRSAKGRGRGRGRGAKMLALTFGGAPRKGGGKGIRKTAFTKPGRFRTTAQPKGKGKGKNRRPHVKILKTANWLNRQKWMRAELGENAVKALGAVTINYGMKILYDIRDAKGGIANPTGFVLSAVRRKEKGKGKGRKGKGKGRKGKGKGKGRKGKGKFVKRKGFRKGKGKGKRRKGKGY